MMENDPTERLQIEEALRSLRVSKRDGLVTSEAIEANRRSAPIIMAPFLIPYYIISFAIKAMFKLARRTTVKPKTTVRKAIHPGSGRKA